MGIGKIVPKSIRAYIRRKIGIEQKISVDKMVSEIADRKKQLDDCALTNQRFRGKVVVITGATGSIGSELCKSFVAEGAKVVACGRSQAKLDALLAREGTNIFPACFDITKESDIEQAFDAIIKEHGRIDVLVNCAGGSSRDDCPLLSEQRVDVIDEILNLNLRAPILCARLAQKIMIKNGYGSIVNFSSLMGLRGKAGYVEYGAAKAGIEGLTRALAVESGKYNINVNCVTPSYVPRMEITYARAKTLQESNYMGTIGASCDISSAVLYLASNEAHFITGQNLIVDGGRSLGLKGD